MDNTATPVGKGAYELTDVMYPIRVGFPDGRVLEIPLTHEMINHYSMARGTKDVEGIVYALTTGEDRKAFKDANGLKTASPHLWHKPDKDNDPELLLRFISEQGLQLPYDYHNVDDQARFTTLGMAQINYSRTHGQALYYGPDAGTVNSKIGSATKQAQAPKHTGKTPDGKLPAFDIGTSVKLGRQVMNAQEIGELHGDFSNRQIIQWARLYYQFVDWGVGVQDAVRLAYHMVVLWRAEKDERDTYVTLFQQEFGYEVKIKSLSKVLGPVIKKMQADLGGKILHPHFPLIMAAVYTKLPLWVHGPSGSGKSFAIRQAAELLGLELVRMQGSSESEGYHVFGRDILRSEDGVTVTERIDGPALYAMQNPTVLNMDEISLFTGSVRSKFHAVLELERTNFVGDDDGGIEYEIHDDTRFIFADNTLGLGEHPKYVGIEPVNEAFRNRCVFVWFPPMTESFQKKAVTQELNDTLDEFGWETI